ncbi:MAG: hypothetical protein KF876_17300 [Nitrospira sp.]|nr:hypothetical protein [Nitrospira sp.]
MSAVGEQEQATQNRVLGLFYDKPGYCYLGEWFDQDRLGEQGCVESAGLLFSPMVFSRKHAHFPEKYFPL